MNKIPQQAIKNSPSERREKREVKMYSPVATNACRSISKLLKQYYFHLHKLTRVNCHLYIMVPIKTSLPTEIINRTSIFLRCFACNVTLLFVRSLFYSSSSSCCTPLSISKTCVISCTLESPPLLFLLPPLSSDALC